MGRDSRVRHWTESSSAGSVYSQDSWSSSRSQDHYNLKQEPASVSPVPASSSGPDFTSYFKNLRAAAEAEGGERALGPDGAPLSRSAQRCRRRNR